MKNVRITIGVLSLSILGIPSILLFVLGALIVSLGILLGNINRIVVGRILYMMGIAKKPITKIIHCDVLAEELVTSIDSMMESAIKEVKKPNEQ